MDKKKNYEKNETMESWTKEQWAEYEDEIMEYRVDMEELRKSEDTGVSKEELLEFFENLKIQEDL